MKKSVYMFYVKKNSKLMSLKDKIYYWLPGKLQRNDIIRLLMGLCNKYSCNKWRKKKIINKCDYCDRLPF
jgi:hypothetical protein